MNDTVESVLATAWAAEIAKQKKILDYIYLIMLEHNAHTLAKHQDTARACDMFYPAKAAYLLARLLNKSKDELSVADEAIRALFGPEELRKFEATWEKLFK